MRVNMDFSVLILSYNSDYIKMLRTIDSVLKQKKVSFEIIICDDASKENHFQQLKTYLSDKQVDFQLLGGDQNMGTVRNILRGLKKACGTYTKLIGAGDMLYNENTLYEVSCFMQKEQTPCCFGMLHGYREKDGKFYSASQSSPRDILAYRQMDTARICRNLMLCEDWVSGASIFATTAYYLKYISLLEGKVIYCEDWATGLAAADHVYLSLLDQYVVWYEVGDGISTSPNMEFQKKIAKDNENFWKLFDQYCDEKYPSEYRNYIRKRRRKKKLEHLSCEWIKLLYKSIVNPDMVLYEFQVRKQQKKHLHLPERNTSSDFPVTENKD